MKMTDIRKLSTSELTQQATGLREEIIQLKRSLVLGETQNVRAVKAKRKDLARTLTVLSDKLLKEAK